MVKRLPDDLFRRRTPEIGQGRQAPDPVEGAEGRTARPRSSRGEGVELRLLVLLLALAIIAGFFGGRIMLLRSTPAAPLASSSASASPDSGSRDQFTAYDGAVVTVEPDTAIGRCPEGRASGGAEALIDQSDRSIWRCGGDGAGMVARFTFDAGATLAGFRIVNGNTAWKDRYKVERRITAVRWIFSDGSQVEQGLAPNNSRPQEVRFPPVSTDSVRMEIISTTLPANSSVLADAVSISSLQFLAPESS